MIKKCIFSFFSFSVIYISNAAELPFSLTKCKQNDSKCVKESCMAVVPVFANGFPEYDVAPLDPLSIDTLDASSPNMKMIVNDITATGLKDCHVLKMDASDNTLVGKVKCDLEIVGKYELSAKLLFITLSSKGRLRGILDQIILESKADMMVVEGTDGKKHWKLKPIQSSFKLTQKAKIEFEDSYNTNDVLNRSLNAFLSENANEILEEVGQPLIDKITQKITSIVNQFLKQFAIDQLVLD